MNTNLPPAGMPGIGGSLGQCALCGDTFLIEVCLGSPIVPFTWSGCHNTIYAHKKCIEELPDKSNLDVLTLPESSPLRKAYLKAIEA